MTVRRSWLVLACALMAIGCGIGSGREAPVDAAAAARLAGSWNVRFHLVTPLAGHDTTGMRDVQGTIALVAQERHRRVPQLDDLTHTGSYDVDFRPFGFDPRDERGVPRAVARVSTPDSVQLVLDPGEQQTPVIMRGAWVADSIAGAWALLAPGRGWGGGAAGTFVLIRRHANR